MINAITPTPTTNYSSNSYSPNDQSSMAPAPKKKAKKNFKLISGLFIFILLMIGALAAFALVRQNQDTRQQASVAAPDPTWVAQTCALNNDGQCVVVLANPLNPSETDYGGPCPQNYQYLCANDTPGNRGGIGTPTASPATAGQIQCYDANQGCRQVWSDPVNGRCNQEDKKFPSFEACHNQSINDDVDQNDSQIELGTPSIRCYDITNNCFASNFYGYSSCSENSNWFVNQNNCLSKAQTSSNYTTCYRINSGKCVARVFSTNPSGTGVEDCTILGAAQAPNQNWFNSNQECQTFLTLEENTTTGQIDTPYNTESECSEYVEEGRTVCEDNGCMWRKGNPTLGNNQCLPQEVCCYDQEASIGQWHIFEQNISSAENVCSNISMNYDPTGERCSSEDSNPPTTATNQYCCQKANAYFYVSAESQADARNICQQNFNGDSIVDNNNCGSTGSVSKNVCCKQVSSGIGRWTLGSASITDRQICVNTIGSDYIPDDTGKACNQTTSQKVCCTNNTTSTWATGSQTESAANICITKVGTGYLPDSTGKACKEDQDTENIPTGSTPNQSCINTRFGGAIDDYIQASSDCNLQEGKRWSDVACDCRNSYINNPPAAAIDPCPDEGFCSSNGLCDAGYTQQSYSQCTAPFIKCCPTNQITTNQTLIPVKSEIPNNQCIQLTGACTPGSNDCCAPGKCVSADDINGKCEYDPNGAYDCPTTNQCGGPTGGYYGFACDEDSFNADGSCTTNGARFDTWQAAYNYIIADNGKPCGQVDEVCVQGTTGGRDGHLCGEFAIYRDGCSGGVTPPSTPVPDVSPMPTEPPIGPMCLSIKMDKTTPQVGDNVTFTCGAVPGATEYRFRVIRPDGTKVKPNSTGRVSQPVQITRPGRYIAQCKICTSAGCQKWEEIDRLKDTPITDFPQETRPPFSTTNPTTSNNNTDNLRSQTNPSEAMPPYDGGDQITEENRNILTRSTDIISSFLRR